MLRPNAKRLGQRRQPVLTLPPLNQNCMNAVFIVKHKSWTNGNGALGYSSGALFYLNQPHILLYPYGGGKRCYSD
jgi:hypothetical protein